MLELLWLEDAEAAQSEQTRCTKLFERCSVEGPDASPFGIILRPASQPAEDWPFRSWEYRPKTMPGLVLQIADDSELNEPMWCYMEGGRAPAEAPPERRQPLDHPAGLRELTRVHLVCPPLAANCVTRAMADKNLITLATGPEHLVELEFDDGLSGSSIDFRPGLPLVLRW
jgi:hypothetical protein